GWDHRQVTRNRPERASTGWPVRQVEAPREELPADSGPGPGAIASPLVKEPAACTAPHVARLAQGWAGHSRPLAPDATHLTRSTRFRRGRAAFGRALARRSIVALLSPSLSPHQMGHLWFIGGSTRALASTPTPLGLASRFRKP